MPMKMFVHECSKPETTQISSNRWVDEQIVAYSCNRTLLSHKREWGADTWNDNGDWKKPDRKKKKDKFHLYKIPEHENYSSSRKQIIGVKDKTHWTMKVMISFSLLNRESVVWVDFCKNMESLVAQMVKNLPAMQEIQVWSLDWEDPLEKEMATHSSILA